MQGATQKTKKKREKLYSQMKMILPLS